MEREIWIRIPTLPILKFNKEKLVFDFKSEEIEEKARQILAAQGLIPDRIHHRMTYRFHNGDSYAVVDYFVGEKIGKMNIGQLDMAV